MRLSGKMKKGLQEGLEKGFRKRHRRGKRVFSRKSRCYLRIIRRYRHDTGRNRERIHNEKDSKVLNGWLKQAAKKAESIDEFVSKM